MKKNTEEQFWAKVDRSGGPEACWPWTEGVSPQGYGLFKMLNRQWRANRLALAFTQGRPIRPGMDALHDCDNPPCCNPAHLREGTDRDNADDAIARGRTAKGARNGRATLTDEQVRAVRERGARGVPLADVAAEFEIGLSTVSDIQRGRTRADAGGHIRASRK